MLLNPFIGGSLKRFGEVNVKKAQGGVIPKSEGGPQGGRRITVARRELRGTSVANRTCGSAYHPSKPWRGKRCYSEELEEDIMDSTTPSRYTDDDFLRGTIEANGFKILGENETEVDIPEWEELTRNAFNQMRFLDCISAYEKIKGLGPNAAEMSDIHIRALDALNTRQDDIITAYRDMRARGIPILSHSYAKVMKAMYKSGEKGKIVSLFELMQSEGTPGTPELYAVLLTLYYKEKPDDIETALGILATMKRNGVAPSVDVIDRALLFFAEAKRYDLIINTYTEYIVNGSVKPERIILSIMAEAMLHGGNLGKARDFLRQLDKLHKYPRLRTYEMLIDLSLKKKRKTQADDALAEMVHNAGYKSTLAVYKSFFEYFAAKNDYDGLQRMLEKMVREQVAPDAKILESMLDVYFAHRKDEEYLATFVQMLDRQFMPRREYWTMRMKVFSEDSEGGMASDGKEHEVSPHQGGIYGETGPEEVKHHSNFTVMLSEYEYMLQVGITPTEEELRLVLNSIQEAEKPEVAEEFAKTEMARYGVQLDTTDYSLLMRNYAKYGESKAAQQNVLRVYERFGSTGLADLEPHLLLLQNMVSWARNPALIAPSVDLLQNPLDHAIQLLENEIMPSLLEGKYFIDPTQACRLIQTFTFLGPHGYDLVMKLFNFYLQLEETYAERVTLAEASLTDAQRKKLDEAKKQEEAAEGSLGALMRDIHPPKPNQDKSLGLFCTDLFDILIKYLATIPSHLEGALAYFKLMQEDPRFKLGPTASMYQQLMAQFALATEREKSSRHITTVIQLFVSYLHDPAMLPLRQGIISVFLLFLIRHGSHHAFSHAINWYKVLGADDGNTLTQFQTAGLRKWAADLQNNPSAFVPKEYTSRDLAMLHSVHLPSEQELALRQYDVPI